MLNSWDGSRYNIHIDSSQYLLDNSWSATASDGQLLIVMPSDGQLLSTLPPLTIREVNIKVPVNYLL